MKPYNSQELLLPKITRNWLQEFAFFWRKSSRFQGIKSMLTFIPTKPRTGDSIPTFFKWYRTSEFDVGPTQPPYLPVVICRHQKEGKIQNIAIFDRSILFGIYCQWSTGPLVCVMASLPSELSPKANDIAPKESSLKGEFEEDPSSPLKGKRTEEEKVRPFQEFVISNPCRNLKLKNLERNYWKQFLLPKVCWIMRDLLKQKKRLRLFWPKKTISTKKIFDLTLKTKSPEFLQCWPRLTSPMRITSLNFIFRISFWTKIHQIDQNSKILPLARILNPRNQNLALHLSQRRKISSMICNLNSPL